MKPRPLLLLFSLLAVVIGQVLAQRKNVFCYYTNWSQYHKGKEFFPENIDPSLCTHLLFAFAKVLGNQLAPYEWNDINVNNRQAGLYYRFNQLKNQNPAVKTLLAVGGWNHGGAPFSAMASLSASRQQFIASCIDYLRNNGFDGLDIDWEYPADPERGGVPNDKANFAALVREMKTAFVAEAQRTGRPQLLLSAAVAAGDSKVAAGYDIPTLTRYLDFINVMTYDLHGSWDKYTGHNAPLYTSSTDNQKYSVSDLALNWANQSDRTKINLGLAAYGRTWTLANPAVNGVGALTNGPGTKGQYSGLPGTLTYYEICDAFKQGGYTKRFDNETKTPYAFRGNQWITYDEVISLQYKMTWIRDHGFAGAMLWAIDEDDFNGISCGQGTYPLTRAVHRCLVQDLDCNPRDGGIVPGTTRPPFVTTMSPIFGSPDCPKYPGMFRDRYDCSRFWVCIPPNLQYRFTCPNFTVFDPYSRVCTQRNSVNCPQFGR